MDELTFERLLERAARSMVYPAAPHLRDRVVTAISAVPARRVAPRARPRFAPAYALAAAALLAAAVVLAVPASRSAVADFFGIEGSEVQVLPTPAPGETPTPFPTPVELEFFATPVSLSEASDRLGYQLAVPRTAGEPQQTYYLDYFDLKVAVLHYETFDLWQTRLGEIQRFQKGVPQDRVIQELTIKGQPARWIAGGNHIVTYVNSAGERVAGTQRTVERSTLIWRTPNAFYRIETALPLAEAVRIAESLP